MDLSVYAVTDREYPEECGTLVTVAVSEAAALLDAAVVFETPVAELTARLVPGVVLPQTEPGIVRNDAWLREHGFAGEEDARCDCCDLATMDGQWPLCEVCNRCDECGHADDCDTAPAGLADTLDDEAERSFAEDLADAQDDGERARIVWNRGGEG
jgi:hypothetical protein